MGYTAKNFWEQGRQAYPLELITGEEGLFSEVKWIYLIEDVRNMRFIKGGELVITTGLESHKEKWLSQFLNALMEKQVSGVIFNIGKCMEEVPEYAITFCREHSLPLFVLPWQDQISDVMQNCCNSILMEQQRSDYLQRFYGGALFEKGFSVDQYSYSDEICVSISGTYQVVVLNASPLPPLLEKTIEIFLAKKELQFFRYVRNAKCYYLLNNPSSRECLDPGKLEALLEEYLISFGISPACSSVHDLGRKRQEAEKAARTALAVHAAYYRYEDLGLYDIVLSVTDTEILRRLYDTTLKPLAEHDALHGTNYLNILRLYIKYNSSAQMVADETYTHLNTIHYRIQRIRQIIGCDLDTMEDRCRLQLAFCTYDLMCQTKSSL